MNTIYKITNLVTNQVYIGQATNVESRFKDYKLRLAKGQPKLNEFFLTYGTSNHKFEILCTCTNAIVDQLEVYFINHYKTYFYKYRNRGLNLTRGGRRGNAHPEETKAKISKSLKGKKQSQDTINKKKVKNSKSVAVVKETLNNPIIFPSLAEAAKKLNIPESTIRYKLVTLSNINTVKKQNTYYIRGAEMVEILNVLKTKIAQ